MYACVCPRVKIAEPCVRGATPTSAQMSRISSARRPSGRRLSTAIRLRMMSFSSLSNARCTSARRCGSTRPPLLVERRVLLEHGLLDGLRRILALELVLDLRRAVELGAVGGADLSSRPWSTCGSSSSLFSLPAFAASSRWAAHSFLISSCAISSASSSSASVISFAPASTIRIASSVPATIRSSSDSARSTSAGLTTNLPSSLPMRTAAICVGNGMSDRASAAEAPFIARMS